MKKFIFKFVNLFKSSSDQQVCGKSGENKSGDNSVYLVKDNIKHKTSESFDNCQSGNAISQREYAALYAKACLYRMLAFELAEKYDEEMFNTIEAVQYIDGKNV